MSWLDRALDALPAQRRALEALAGATNASLNAALEPWETPGMSAQEAQGAAEGVFAALAQGRTSAEAVGAAAALQALAGDRIQVVPPATSSKFYRAVEGTVDRNLAALTDDPSPEMMRRTRHRLRLAAGVLTRHYYWEAQRATFRAAAKAAGVQVRFMWVANIVNGNPCPTCLALHGTQVGAREQFPHGPPGSPKVFLALTSPPRHPNCQCTLVPYVVNLETAITPPLAPAPSPPPAQPSPSPGPGQPTPEPPARPSEVVPRVEAPTEEEDSYSASEIRRLPLGIFNSILAALAATIAWFGRRLS